MASVSTASSWNQCSAESCPEDDGSSPGLSAVTGEKGDSDKVAGCDTLRMCIITTVNWGLRNGGGIGDVLRKMDPHVSLCNIGSRRINVILRNRLSYGEFSMTSPSG